MKGKQGTMKREMIEQLSCLTSVFAGDGRNSPERAGGPLGQVGEVPNGGSDNVKRGRQVVRLPDDGGGWY